MSIYRNQAKRVIDHICTSLYLSEAKVNELFKININQIETAIEGMVKTTAMNGKQAADMVIKTFDASHPDYISREYSTEHIFNNQKFNMKVLSREIIVFYTGEKGDYLHSFKHDGRQLTSVYKDVICKDCLDAYNKKIEAL